MVKASVQLLGNLWLLPCWQQTSVHFVRPDLTITSEAYFVALAFVLIA
jgi:hypothetical protein